MSCRRCLALMDMLFRAPELDDRSGLALQAITGTVAGHGYAEIRDVPAAGRPRSASRSGQRSRSAPAAPVQTLGRSRLLVFACEPIRQQHAGERGHAVARATAMCGRFTYPRPVAYFPRDRGAVPHPERPGAR
ncbi:MAG TPA: hypothetical protein VFQ44_16450 [Streptosporangiaceae bacterium]|nr:hypothetical protein [Streptosporangiaceae bacterium]